MDSQLVFMSGIFATFLISLMLMIFCSCCCGESKRDSTDITSDEPTPTTRGPVGNTTEIRDRYIVREDSINSLPSTLPGSGKYGILPGQGLTKLRGSNENFDQQVLAYPLLAALASVFNNALAATDESSRQRSTEQLREVVSLPEQRNCSCGPRHLTTYDL